MQGQITSFVLYINENNWIEVLCNGVSSVRRLAVAGEKSRGLVLVHLVWLGCGRTRRQFDVDSCEMLPDAQAPNRCLNFVRAVVMMTSSDHTLSRHPESGSYLLNLV